MLKSLTTKNFRKLNDHTFTFTEGLNLVIGANENGKSSLLEAILYALFGVKACRTPLAEVATWGTKASDVRVELGIHIHAVEYTINRSNSGAELRYNAGVVTGQTEVSNFIAEKMGVSVNAATRLMLASQNEIRGSLGGADAETIKLIESLANLSVIDKIADAVKDQLPTGADVAVKGRLEVIAANLASLTPPAPEDLEAVRAEVIKIQQDKEEAEGRLLITQKEIADRTQHLNTLVKIKEAYEADDKIYRALVCKVAELEARAKQAPPCAVVEAVQIEKLEQDLEAAEADRKQTQEAMKQFNAGVQEAQAEAAAATHALAKLKIQIESPHCLECGQALPNLEDIRVRNEKLQVEIDHAAQRKQAAEARAKLDWTGPSLAAQEQKVAGLILELKTLRRQLEHYQYHLGQVAEVENSLAEARQNLADFRRSEAPPPAEPEDIEEVENAVARLSNCYSAIAEEIKCLVERSKAQQVELNKLLYSQQTYEQRRGDLVKSQEQAQKELYELTFNNQLLKRLRELRPEVANYLWNKVLGVVSHYFSQMRGTGSIVEKVSGGFTVDGRAVAGLSGSTIDMLGLAVRLALSKTFAPHFGLMVLDEPFAGCDEERTANSLAFVASCGFNQILLVTHETVSETLANNIISV